MSFADLKARSGGNGNPGRGAGQTGNQNNRGNGFYQSSVVPNIDETQNDPTDPASYGSMFHNLNFEAKR